MVFTLKSLFLEHLCLAQNFNLSVLCSDVFLMCLNGNPIEEKQVCCWDFVQHDFSKLRKRKDRKT